MRLCYIKREIETITQIFLFNKKYEADNYVLNRKKETDKPEKTYKILISEVDSNFLKIFEKMGIFEIKDIVYTIEYKRYKIGDIEIQFGMIQKDLLNKFYFYGITNYYVHRFEDAKDFCYEIMENFFPNIPKETLLQSCRINEKIIENNKIYQEPKSESKKDKTYHYHLELIQYIYYILNENEN